MVIIPDPSLTRFFFSAEIIRSAASCMDAVGGRKVSPYGCATIMLLCYALQVRTAEDVCPYGLCLFRCVVVGNAFRRDARPRPTVVPRWCCCVMYCFFGTEGVSVYTILEYIVH